MYALSIVLRYFKQFQIYLQFQSKLKIFGNFLGKIQPLVRKRTQKYCNNFHQDYVVFVFYIYFQKRPAS